MKTTSSKVVRAAIAALMLYAVFGTARAQHVYELPSGAVIVIPSFSDEEGEAQAAARAPAERRQRMIDDCAQSNGTECEREVDTELRAEGVQQAPFLRDVQRDEQTAAHAQAERRQEMIDDCERNRGTECEREVDTELRAEALQSGGRVIRLRPAR